MILFTMEIGVFCALDACILLDRHQRWQWYAISSLTLSSILNMDTTILFKFLTTLRIQRCAIFIKYVLNFWKGDDAEVFEVAT
jgi:bacteriorhodopsin